jgi:hypothetical protein
MPLPPTKDILETIQFAVLPTAGAAALVVCASHVAGRVFVAVASRVGAVWERMRTGYMYPGVRGAICGRQLVALGVAAAVVIAFLAGNFTLDNLKPREEPSWDNTTRLVPWKPGENAAGWHWLPRAGLLLVAVGLLSRWIGLVAARYLPDRLWWGANLLVWAPRIAVVVVAAGWLASGKANEGKDWLWYALAGAMLLGWVALDGVARSGPEPETDYDPRADREPDVSCSAEVAVYLWLILLAGGAVLLYAHSGRFMEIAVVLGSAMFGVAVAAWSVRADASAAVPAAVAVLPGLMLNSLIQLDNHLVPKESFWLVALAPVTLLPFLIPVLGRSTAWYVRVLRLILVLAPLVAAVYLAAKYEAIAGQDDWS